MLRASLISAAVLVVSVGRADADVIALYGNVQGGAMAGKGTGGDQKGEDFFANAPNGAYGAAVAARFFFLSAEISHRQYAFFGGGDRTNDLRTWTQFSLGVDFDVSLGTETEKKQRKGKFLTANAMAGFGLGTGQQVDPPLDNSEVTDKGFVLGGRLGIGTHLSKNLDFGLMVPVQYHYLFKNGVDTVVNDVTNHYQGIAVQALLFLRVYIKLI